MTQHTTLPSSSPPRTLPVIIIRQDGTRLYLSLEGFDPPTRWAFRQALYAAFPRHAQLYYIRGNGRYRLWASEVEALGHFADRMEAEGMATVVWEGS